jgi:hypothetical protein
MKYIICILASMAGMFFVAAQQTYTGKSGEELKLRGPVKGFSFTSKTLLVVNYDGTYSVDFDADRAPSRVIEWDVNHKLTSVSHYYKYKIHTSAIRSHFFRSPDTTVTGINVTPTGVTTLSDNSFTSGTQEETIYSFDNKGKVVKAEQFLIDSSGRRLRKTQYITYTAAGKIAEERHVVADHPSLSYYLAYQYDRSNRVVKKIMVEYCSGLTATISLAALDCKGEAELYEYRPDSKIVEYHAAYIPNTATKVPKFLRVRKAIKDKNGLILEAGNCDTTGAYTEKPSVCITNKAGQLVQNTFYLDGKLIVAKYEYNNKGDLVRQITNGRIDWICEYEYDSYNNWTKKSMLNDKGQKFYEITRTFRYGN